MKPDVHVRGLVVLGAEAIVEQAERESADDEQRRTAAIKRLIAWTTQPGGIDHEAARHVNEVLGIPRLADDA